MWRSLAVTVLCVAIASPVAAKQDRVASDTMFCSQRADLLMYAIAQNAKEFKNQAPAGCTMLRKGQRYTVLGGEEGSMVKIRVHLPRRGTVEGYAVNPGQ